MYIGNTVQNQGFVPAVDFFSGNASTTAFTLSRPVASTYQMIVVVANVVQNPGSAFTVSGNTITFSSAPPSGTNNIWVEYTSLITQTIAPSPGTVGASQLPQSQILTSVQQPTGSVIQVVNATYNTYTTTTSTSYSATGLTATITPQFSTSKILILINHPETQRVSNGTAGRIKFQLAKNGSGLAQFGQDTFYTGTVTGLVAGVSYTYLDSPATTSATTYSTNFASTNGADTMGVQYNSIASIITLMEIR